MDAGALNYMHFQQDEGPTHNARMVDNYSNDRYPNHLLRTNGLIRWPTRSPNLHPLDFLL